MLNKYNRNDAPSQEDPGFSGSVPQIQMAFPQWTIT